MCVCVSVCVRVRVRVFFVSAACRGIRGNFQPRRKGSLAPAEHLSCGDTKGSVHHGVSRYCANVGLPIERVSSCCCCRRMVRAVVRTQHLGGLVVVAVDGLLAKDDELRVHLAHHFLEQLRVGRGHGPVGT